MDTLKNKVIIYDDVCPLCKAYTGAFVRLGWLKQRTGFACAPAGILDQIDLDRARHEIPLYDQATGKTLYGLDALFFIIGNRVPLLQPLLRSSVFRAFIKQLYQVVTYNRRIIAGSRAPAEGFDCAPDVNRFYRWLYIILAGTAGIWLTTAHGPAGGVAIMAVHLLWLGAGRSCSRDRLTFTGHWATIFLLAALAGSLLPGTIPALTGMAGVSLWLWYKRWDLFQLTLSAT